MHNDDDTLNTFYATAPGSYVKAIIDNPDRVAEMVTIAGHGLAPVRVLEMYLPSEAKSLLGGVWLNSLCGKACRKAISRWKVPSGDRELNLKGPTFKSGALYMDRP